MLEISQKDMDMIKTLGDAQADAQRKMRDNSWKVFRKTVECHPDDYETVRTALEDAGIKMASAEVSMIPQTYVTLTDETDLKNINKILDLLDDDDDVQEVYHNWEE